MILKHQKGISENYDFHYSVPEMTSKTAGVFGFEGTKFVSGRDILSAATKNPVLSQVPSQSENTFLEIDRTLGKKKNRWECHGRNL